MGAAKKLGMTPDEAWLAERVKDGRARLEPELSMKALGTPDVRLQQRVVHLDEGHVARLDRMRREGTTMYPVVVFWDETLDMYYLADGHHRHKMCVNARLASIRAYVIKGTWRDAMLYSVICNQLAAKPRTPEDIKKAVTTLLGDEEWFSKSCRSIGLYVGCSHAVVLRCKAALCASSDIETPAATVDSRGNARKAFSRKRHELPALSQEKRGNIETRLNGEKIRLGSDPDEAKKKLGAIHDSVRDKRASLAPRCLVMFLAARGFHFVSTHMHFGPLYRIPAYAGNGTVFVSLAVDPTKSLAGVTRNVTDAVGSVFMAREGYSPSSRAVVVSYTEEWPSGLIALARQLGVEFLTPEELVASLTPPEE